MLKFWYIERGPLEITRRSVKINGAGVLLVIVYTIVRQIRLQNFLRQNSFVRIFSSSFREGKGAIVTHAGFPSNDPFQSYVIANLQQEPNS